MKNESVEEQMLIYGKLDAYKLMEMIQLQMQIKEASSADKSLRKVLQICLFRLSPSKVDYSFILHKVLVKGIHREAINWNAVKDGDTLMWMNGLYLPSSLVQHPCVYFPECHPNKKKIGVYKAFNDAKISKKELLLHAAFEGCTHVIPLSDGIVWRNRKNEVHVYCPQGRISVISAFYDAVWKGVNGIVRPQIKDEIPFNMLRDKVLEKHFWIAIATLFGRAAGWGKVRTNLDGAKCQAYKMPIEITAEDSAVGGGRSISLTKRALIEYVTYQAK